MFQDEYSNQGKRFLKKSDSHIYERISKKLVELWFDPIPKDAISLKGDFKDTWRVRVGDYRIIYTIFFEDDKFVVTYIDKRSRVYKF